jgi:hypothetical protein
VALFCDAGSILLVLLFAFHLLRTKPRLVEGAEAISGDTLALPLKIAGVPSFAALDRAYAHTLTAPSPGSDTTSSVRDATATRSTRCVPPSTISPRHPPRIEIDRGYIADLTAHELAAERKLTAQVLSFFVSVRQRSGLTPGFAESFQNSWTATPARGGNCSANQLNPPSIYPNLISLFLEIDHSP